jgi:acyl dehydratase
MVGELPGRPPDDLSRKAIEDPDYPLDDLSRSLIAWESEEVVVWYEGYRARVGLDTLTDADENESGYGDWLAHVREVLEDSHDNPYSGYPILDISLEDPPLKVTTLAGDVIWERPATATGGLEHIPEYLSDEAKQALLALTVESEPEPAPLVVNEYVIRHWCETLEDGNPLYFDEAYARTQGLPGIVAPPGAIMTAFTTPFRWPWPPDGRAPRPHIHYEVKEALGLPVGIITDIDVEYGERPQLGDRISVSQRLVSVSPWKKTKIGEGHFWTMDRIYRNQHGQQLARERMTAFGYGRNEGAAGTAGAYGGWSPAVEEMIEGERTGYQPLPVRELFWEDANIGEELPRLVMPFTVTRAVYMASATRDFSPQHSNRDYAQQRSMTRDVFVNTPFNVGMISRFLTDWAGPRSTVRRVRLAMRGNVCVGDDMIIDGRVSRKYVEDGEHRVEVEVTISTQETPVTPCTAVVALPSRRRSA